MTASKTVSLEIDISTAEFGIMHNQDHPNMPPLRSPQIDPALSSCYIYHHQQQPIAHHFLLHNDLPSPSQGSDTIRNPPTDSMLFSPPDITGKRPPSSIANSSRNEQHIDGFTGDLSPTVEKDEPKPKFARGTRRACTVCRRLKMECVGAEQGPPCKRCLAGDYECIFFESNRRTRISQNRELSTKSLHRMERTLDTVLRSIGYSGMTFGMISRSPSPPQIAQTQALEQTSSPPLQRHAPPQNATLSSPSLKVHSLPDNALNPLGLLAEATLGSRGAHWIATARPSGGESDHALNPAALSLDPPSPQEKQSKTYLTTGSWQQALSDANQAIALDPLSPLGYEARHAALHQAGDFENAVVAFEEMLSKIDQAPDPEVRRELYHLCLKNDMFMALTDRGDCYIRPSSTRAMIRRLVQKTIVRLPRELINTINGHMYNRADLELTFQSSLVCHELVSAMTIRIDYARIKREVRQYFQYVMLSHKWEPGEPSFQDVVRTSVYTLEPSPTHSKLQTFCKLVRDHGFIWAWSDTCCINRSDHSVLQEALVAMFRWYEGSALTIIYLRGVSSLSRLGALMRSIWNTRAWTLQEYIAAKVVLFYTEDWTRYLDLQVWNHKESQEVISEMEEATGVSATELMALRPGLGNIREKLRLASSRKTTLVEDEAYSLLGIFSASGVPAIYGEREGALGRLLANVVTRSGDVSVLAWTGDSGPFNSCLPAHVSVYNGPITSHLPAYISDSEMVTILTASHISRFDLNAALRLYDHLCDLPSPRFTEGRLTLVSIIFQLPRLSLYHTSGQLRFYHTNIKPFGRVEIKTKTDLSHGTLYLVHPWLRSLFEHKDMYAEDRVDDEMEDEEANDRVIDHETTIDVVDESTFGDADSDTLSSVSEAESPLLSPIPPSPRDREMQARRLVVRLRQPFGALLLKLRVSDQGPVAYERVATDSMINVRFREDFRLDQIMGRVHTVDVL